MAARNTFKERLRQGLAAYDLGDTAQFREVVAMLRDIALVVEEFLKEGQPNADVSVDVVPGHLVNAGLEHRIVVRAPSRGLSDYLLRAYVPLEGYPVIVDSVEEEDVEYDTPQTLQNALVELVQQPWFRERLAGLREILRDPQMRSDRRKVKTMSPRPKKSRP